MIDDEVEFIWLVNVFEWREFVGKVYDFIMLWCSLSECFILW